MKVEYLNSAYDIQPVILYVSPNGNDNNEGTKEHPLQTMQAAVNTAKSLNASSKIILSDDCHYIDDTVLIQNNINRLEITSNSGTSKISACKLYTELTAVDGVVTIDFNYDYPVNFIIVNGKMVKPCKSHYGRFNAALMTSFSKISTGNRYVFSIGLQPEDYANCEVGCRIRMLSQWYDRQLEVISKQEDYKITAQDTLDGGQYSEPLKDSYITENCSSYLDKGTFYYKNNKIHYKLNDNDDISTLKIEVPTICDYIEVLDSANVYINGITFEGSDYVQNETNNRKLYRGTIKFNNCININIENCNFKNSSQSCIVGKENCKYVTIQNNYFRYIDNAITMSKINYSYVVPSDSDNDYIKIHNNLIKHYNAISYNNAAIRIANSNNVEISNNTICDGSAGGIIVGSYTYNIQLHNIIIRDNHVHHCGGYINDFGGIYNGGANNNVRIHHNKVHDIKARKSENGICIYNDIQSSYTWIKNNLIYGGDKLFLLKGRAHLIENNIAMYCNVACISPSYDVGDGFFCNTILKGNVFYSPSKPFLTTNDYGKPLYYFNNNIFDPNRRKRQENIRFVTTNHYSPTVSVSYPNANLDFNTNTQNILNSIGFVTKKVGPQSSNVIKNIFENKYFGVTLSRLIEEDLLDTDYIFDFKQDVINSGLNISEYYS